MPPVPHFFSIRDGFSCFLIYAKQSIFCLKAKFREWEQGMQNIMSSSYPEHFGFSFDFWVEKGDSNGPSLAGKRRSVFRRPEKHCQLARNHTAVSQHISRLGFLLQAGHSAPTGAGLTRKWMVTPFPPSTPSPCAPSRPVPLGCQRGGQPALARG